MTDTTDLSRAPLGLASALSSQGFESLTEVQAAVLDADADGRDLRVSSQTGSGKTVALGLAIATDVAAHHGDASQRRAAPTVLLIAPTRELAQQLGRELTWLYEPLRASVEVVMGGISPMLERRALARGPAVVVGTPGRLLDHLRRGGLVLDDLRAVVLDEADQMLDMDFEEELRAILGFAPEERRTHLVSATFPPAVQRLANAFQRDPLPVQGTSLGVANTDIEHLAMVVPRHQQLNALINVLLSSPDDKTLVFARTRADTEEIARDLSELGFVARALHGDMTQRERSATFDLFRSGACACLVATDVAARGLDVHDIARVVQVDPPMNADTFTHRSGRTGRAGRAGLNILFVPPHGRRRVEQLLRGARVQARFVDVPGAREIRESARQRLRDELSAKLAERSVPTEDQPGTELDRPEHRAPRPSEARSLAEDLLESHDPVDLVEALLTRVDYAGPCEPREVRLPPERQRKARPERPERDGRPAAPRNDGDFVTFQVSWGSQRGADPSRLLAILCRRGGVTRDDVGSIRIQAKSSTVEVHRDRAAAFEQAVRRPDRRDPHVRFRRWLPPGERGASPRHGGNGKHRHAN